MPVLQTDGRSLARSVYGHVITKFSGMGRLPHFLSYGAPVELRYKYHSPYGLGLAGSFVYNFVHYFSNESSESLNELENHPNVFMLEFYDGAKGCTNIAFLRNREI